MPVAILCLLAVAAANDAPKRPNIIFILADDLGYGDLGCYGQREIRTPSLDKMAREGIRFTDMHSGSTVCAPSRCTLMTGLHCGHSFIRGNGRENLRPEDVTVAEVLKGAGYATAIVGKWGLGHDDSTGLPTRKGFDYFYGFLDHVHAHNYYPSFLFRGVERVSLRNVVPNEGPVGQGVASQKVEYAPDLFEKEAIERIEAWKDRPFFLYLAMTQPHANNEAKDRGMETPTLGEYASRSWPEPEKGRAAMITRLDASVGRILDRLRELGLDHRTIVFFSSDNGPHHEGGSDPKFFHSSGPFRGHKRDLYEGGIRVPFIVRWPGQTSVGSTSDFIGAFEDFLPTAAELAGVSPPKGLDGVSLAATIRNRPAEQKAHDYLYWEFHERNPRQAVRFGKWKGILSPGGRVEIYDLSRDTGEEKDLSQSEPDKVKTAKKLAASARTPSARWRHPLENR